MAEEILKKAVIIGGSAGSLSPLLHILKNLSPAFDLPVIIVVHRNNDPSSSLDMLLNQSSRLPVKEAEDKEPILDGIIYLAPADYHLLIEKERTFSLDASEKINFSRPSIDVSMQTAAEAYGQGLLAVLLSGANDDGTAGFAAVKAAGGIAIVQDPEEAAVPKMTQSVIRKRLADKVLTTGEIKDYLLDFSQQPG
jgi:two-component system chemotaxis response regulator CheB